jgi:hypothetical protein
METVTLEVELPRTAPVELGETVTLSPLLAVVVPLNSRNRPAAPGTIRSTGQLANKGIANASAWNSTPARQLVFVR